MSRRGAKAFWRNQTGATAALYALALPALIAVAGVGFDYARLAGMDSELQNAADQAALAGVTQLDGSAGACERAANAARTLVENQTRLANDGEGLLVTWDHEDESACDTDGVIRFWKTVDANGTGMAEATTDAEAKYLEIVLEDRAANYAFTPIAGPLVGQLNAAATAGLNSAICKAAVLFMCNMDSGDPDFTVANYIGRGVNVTKEGSKGNWGFVGPGNDNPTLRRTLGLDSAPYACVSLDGGVDVAPGNDANKQVVDAFNTRFDVSNDCPVAGGCSASANATKDLVANGAASCPTWQESSQPYAPAAGATSPLPIGGTDDPDAMGYPRDICHASGATCASGDPDIVGDGAWDVGAYFRVNYGVSDWKTVPGLVSSRPGGGNPLRYDVYRWELDHAGETLNGHTILGNRTIGSTSLNARGAPQCVSAITPSPTAIDRRLISVAVVSKAECDKIKGNSYNPEVDTWVDAFLIEPMADRSKTYKNGGGSSAKEIYVEIVRQTPAGGQAESPVRRDVPYLVR